MPLLLLLLALPLLIVLLMPLILLQRYRAGTARRLARPWVATLNLIAMVVSVAFFFVGVTFTNIWIPRTLSSAALGVAIGALLGVIGLAASRWESTARALHYTPNRWIVLSVTLVVSARLLYGLWRGFETMRQAADASFVTAFGVPSSLGAGGVVLGYYLVYAIGLRWRIWQWEKRPLRVM